MSMDSRRLLFWEFSIDFSMREDSKNDYDEVVLLLPAFHEMTVGGHH
jgi:hypothetical protein